MTVTAPTVFVAGLVVVVLLTTGAPASAITAPTPHTMPEWCTTTVTSSPMTEVVVDAGATNPAAPRAADMDGDGWLDLVILTTNDDTTGWFTNAGDGSGSFSPSRTVIDNGAAFPNPSQLAVADLNGDALPDLILFSGVSDSFAVSLAASPAVYPPPSVAFDPARDTSSFIVLDIDADGDQDLLMYKYGAGSYVAFAANNGGGSFPAPLVVLDSNTTDVSQVVAADVNADGFVDLLFADGESLLYAMYSTGSPAAFGPLFVLSHASVVGPAGLGSLAVGDLNADGALDIVASGNNNANIDVWLGNPAAPGEYPDIAFDAAPVGTTVPDDVSLADINGDGHLDLVVETGYSYIRFAYGTGTGRFHPVINSGIGGMYYPNYGIADVNNDSRPDLFAAGYSAGGVRVSLGHTDATWGPDPIPLGVALDSWRVTTGDMDSDGYVDVVVGSSSPTALSWFRNTGGGTFSAVPTRIGLTAVTPSFVVAADLNGDGDLDVAAVIGTSSTSTVRWWASVSHGLAFDEPASHLILSAPSSLDALRVYDLDDDGDLDLVGASTAWDTLHIFLNDGPDATSWPLVFAVNATNDIRSFDFVDLDGDGLRDFVYDDRDANAVRWARRASPAALVWTPEPAPVTALLPEPVTVVSGDFNGDATPDLFFRYDGYRETAVVYGQPSPPGSASFTNPTWLPITMTAMGTPVTGDVNNDGYDDLVIFPQMTTNGTTSWIPGSQAGLVSPVLPLMPTRSVIEQGILADVNGDGFLDALYAIRHSGNVEYVPLIPGPSVPSRRPGLLTSHYTRGHLANLPAALASASLCYHQALDLAPGSRFSHCRQDSHWPIPARASWQIAGPDAALDCSPDGGVLFEPQPGASLALKDVAVTDGSVGTGVTASAALRVTGPGASLTLLNTTVSGCSSTSGDPVQQFSGLGGAILVADGGSLLVRDSTLVGNTARVAGGAFALVGSGSSAAVDGVSVLRSNVAQGRVNQEGGGGGGAVAVVGPQAVLDLASAAELVDNVAQGGSGGGVLVRASALQGSVSVAATVRDNTADGGMGGCAAVLWATPASVAPSLTLAPSAVLSGCRAELGGALAVSHTSGIPTETDPFLSLAGIPNIGSSLAGSAPTVVTAQPGAAVVAPSATYGGLIYACGAVADLTQAVVSGPPFASVLGDVALLCNPAADAWAPGVAAAKRATPPASLVLHPDPAAALAAASGVELGSTASVLVLDGYGNPVDDPRVVAFVSVAQAYASELGVSGVDLGIPVSPGGVISLARVVLTGTRQLIGTNATSPAALQIDVGGVPTLALSVQVGGCPIGHGNANPSSQPGDAVACVVCTDGSYSDTVSMEPCVPIPVCPTNTQRVTETPGQNASLSASSIPPCVCKAGTWSVSGEVDVACEPCPIGGICVGGRAAPVAAPGYFPDPDSGAGSFVACPNPSACAGVSGCAPGYQSQLCAECASGYYALGRTCRKCSSELQSSVIVLVLIGAILVCAVLMAFNLTESVRYKFAAAMIGLNGLQISALYGKLELDWGPFAELYFDIASSLNVNFELMGPECTAASGTDVWVLRWMLTLLLPVFAAVGLAFVAAVVFYPLSAVGLVFADATVASLAGAVKRAWFQALVLLYLPLTAAAFALFGCRKDSSGRWVLDPDPARSCFTPAWWGLFPVGLVAAVGYGAGVPLAVLWTLVRNRADLDETTFVLRFGFLVGRFNPASWWFEAALMARKAGVVICMTFFFSDTSKANAAVLVLAAALLHLALARPYARRFHNILALVVLAAVSLVLYAGTFDDTILRALGVVIGILVILAAIIGGNVLEFVILSREEAAAEENEFYSAGMFANANAIDPESTKVSTCASMTDSVELGIVGPPSPTHSHSQSAHVGHISSIDPDLNSNPSQLDTLSTHT